MDDREYEVCDLVGEKAELASVPEMNPYVAERLGEMRRAKAEMVEYVELLEGPRFSDFLAEAAEKTLLARLGGKEARKITRTELLSMQAEMLKDGDSPLEILLVRQISLCHLTLQVYQRDYLNLNEDEVGLKKHALLLKRLNMANEQYMSAIKTLAQVRRLRKMTVQVNIGNKQVNIANLDRPGSR